MKNFITTLFDLAIDHKDWCEGQIKSRLNNWEFGRVALLDRLMLVVAISEIHFVEDVPPKVSIAESVEIAKQFSTEDSSGFINGILDSVYNETIKAKNAKPPKTPKLTYNPNKASLFILILRNLF